MNLFPRKYEDRRQETRIEDLQPGKEFLISGKVLSRRYSGNPYKKNTPLTLLVSDETGTVEIFFSMEGILQIYLMSIRITLFMAELQKTLTANR